MTSKTVTNGEHWVKGVLHVWCGNTVVAIRKRDVDGNDVKPPEPEPENNDNQQEQQT